MGKLDRFNGALVIIVLVMWAVIRAGENIHDHTGWHGVVFAFSSIWIGGSAIASVWRDRL